MPTRTSAKKKRPVAKKKTKKSAKKAVKRTLKKAVKKAVKKVARSTKKKVIAKAKKKAVKNILKKVNSLGKVVHYFGHIGVAIVEVAMPIRVGDTVRIQHGTHNYPMVITSLQIDHVPVASAKKKDVVGMKVNQKVPPGALVMPV